MLRHSSPSCLQVSLGLLVFYHSHYFQVGAPTCASILTCDWLHHNTEFCFHICLSLQTAEALRTALHLTLCLQVLLNQSPEGSLILWSPHTPRSPIQETSGLPLDGADGVGEEWGDGSGMQVPRGVHWGGGGDCRAFCCLSGDLNPCISATCSLTHPCTWGLAEPVKLLCKVAIQE
jgi:hypothetical protein